MSYLTRNSSILRPGASQPYLGTLPNISPNAQAERIENLATRQLGVHAASSVDSRTICQPPDEFEKIFNGCLGMNSPVTNNVGRECPMDLIDDPELQDLIHKNTLNSSKTIDLGPNENPSEQDIYMCIKQIVANWVYKQNGGPYNGIRKDEYLMRSLHDPEAATVQRKFWKDASTFTGVFLPRIVVEKALKEEKNKMYALQIMAEDMSKNHFKLPATDGSVHCRINVKFFDSIRAVRDKFSTCALTATIGVGAEHMISAQSVCEKGSHVTTVNTGPDTFSPYDQSVITFLPPITEHDRNVIELPTTETRSRNILNLTDPNDTKVSLTVLNMRVAAHASVELNALMKAVQIAMTEATYDHSGDNLTSCYIATCDFILVHGMDNYIKKYHLQECGGKTNKLWAAVMADMKRSPDPLLFLRHFVRTVLPAWYNAITKGPSPLSPPLSTLTNKYYELHNILAKTQAFLKPARSGAIGQEIMPIIDPRGHQVDGYMRNWLQYIATGLFDDQMGVAIEEGKSMGETYRASMSTLFYMLDLLAKSTSPLYVAEQVGHIYHASEKHITRRGDKIHVILPDSGRLSMAVP